MTKEFTHVRRVIGSRARALLVTACCALVVFGCRQGKEETPDRPLAANNAEAATLQEFETRVTAYAAVHKRIEGELPALPKEATPQQIDTRQRELGQRVAAERANAKQGDLLTPAMQALIHTHFLRIFNNRTDGQDVRGSVMDENPTGVRVAVNQRYPDDVPLSTMPPDVLEFLPKMPEELEFRFVGRHLVIMDPHAHLIVDFIPDAIPQ